MLRRLAKIGAVTVLSAVTFGVIGAGSAEAITIPNGPGTISCDASGSAKVTPSTPSKSRLGVNASLGNCDYNGTAIPFTGGISRTVGVGQPSKWCTALASGSAAAQTTVKITLGRTVLAQLPIKVTLSGSGTDLDATGTWTKAGVTVTLTIDLQADRPIADLCTGSTVNFSGDLSVAWTRV